MGKVYASSDWHGSETAFKVLDFLKSDDILYFLGDIIDRGTRGADLLDILMNRPNTYFIKGNHEHMMSLCLPYIIKDLEEIKYFKPERYFDQTWFNNGGWKTIEGGLLDRSCEKLNEYKEFIDSLPFKLKYKSPKSHTVILEHAGYTPFDIPHRSHDPLWDREHFYDRWYSGSGASEIARDTYLVHGHTPVNAMKYYFGYIDCSPLTKEEMKHKYKWWTFPAKVIQYCDGHKFNIDMGTADSNRIALLNLDTFEKIYFDGDKNND